MYATFFQDKQVNTHLEDFIQTPMVGDINIIKHMLSEVDVNETDDCGDVSLSQAALKGYSSVVDNLLTQSVSNDSKNHALILACQAGHLAIVDKLLKHGADVNVYMQDYHTPLFQAIAQNKFEVFERLLQEKAIEINLEDAEGAIPLLLAAYNGRTKMFEKLLDNGADLLCKNKQGWTVKSMASRARRYDIMQCIERRETANSNTF